MVVGSNSLTEARKKKTKTKKQCYILRNVGPSPWRHFGQQGCYYQQGRERGTAAGAAGAAGATQCTATLLQYCTGHPSQLVSRLSWLVPARSPLTSFCCAIADETRSSGKRHLCPIATAQGNHFTREGPMECDPGD